MDDLRETQWTPTSKKLPDKDGDYLVTFKLLFTRPVEVCTFSNGYWDKGAYEEVLAWQPLPEPWKGEQP
jgi:hypothetical protein